jgi:fatty acid desaturase
MVMVVVMVVMIPVMVMVVMVVIIPAIMMVVMMVMMMIPAMVMVVVMVVVIVIVPILRVFHVRVLPGLPLGARCAHRVGRHQQSDRIRDWLEKLRIRPGAQNFSHVLRPRRSHGGHRCKGRDCAHKACDLLVHVDLQKN